MEDAVFEVLFHAIRWCDREKIEAALAEKDMMKRAALVDAMECHRDFGIIFGKANSNMQKLKKDGREDLTTDSLKRKRGDGESGGRNGNKSTKKVSKTSSSSSSSTNLNNLNEEQEDDEESGDDDDNVDMGGPGNGVLGENGENGEE